MKRTTFFGLLLGMVKSDIQVVNLNMAREFAGHLNEPWRPVHELIQNTFDRAREMDAKYFELIENRTDYVHYEYVDKASITFAEVNNNWVLTLTNYNTTLDLSAFIHGHSTKKDSLLKAGYFGDGLKVALSRLLATPSTDIAFINADNVITFKYLPVGSVDSLHLVQTPLSEPRPKNLEVVVKNISKEAFDPRRYTVLVDTLIPATSKLTVPSVATFYHTPSQHLFQNAIYLQGLLLKEVEPDFGLENSSIDVYYPTSTLVKSYGLGRDRNSFNWRELMGSVLWDLIPTAIDTIFPKLYRLSEKKIEGIKFVEVHGTSMENILYTYRSSNYQRTSVLATAIDHLVSTIMPADSPRLVVSSEKDVDVFKVLRPLFEREPFLVKLTPFFNDLYTGEFKLEAVVKKLIFDLRDSATRYHAEKEVDKAYIQNFISYIQTNFQCIDEIIFITMPDFMLAYRGSIFLVVDEENVQLLIDPRSLGADTIKRNGGFVSAIENTIKNQLRVSGLYNCLYHFEMLRTKQMEEMFNHFTNNRLGNGISDVDTLPEISENKVKLPEKGDSKNDLPNKLVFNVKPQLMFSDYHTIISKTSNKTKHKCKGRREGTSTSKEPALPPLDMQLIGEVQGIKVYYNALTGKEAFDSGIHSEYTEETFNYVVTVLVRLATQVFMVPLSDIGIYYDGTLPLAFNSEGHLMFNLSGVSQVEKIEKYLYVLFVHELSHNTVADHNHLFIQNEETIVFHTIENMLYMLTH